MAYKAVFLIPAGAQRSLTEDGWCFETDSKLPPDIVKLVVEGLSLMFEESYSDLLVYVGEGVKATFFLAENELVEHVYFQLSGRSVHAVRSLLSRPGFENAEVFVP